MSGTSKVRTIHADAQAEDQMGRPVVALETNRIDVSGVANGHPPSSTGIKEGSSLWSGSFEERECLQSRSAETENPSGNEAQLSLPPCSVVSERSHLKHYGWFDAKDSPYKKRQNESDWNPTSFGETRMPSVGFTVGGEQKHSITYLEAW